MTDRVVVSQLGARMHYAVPRILDIAGELERFYTDICADQGWPSWLRSLPQSLLPPAVRRLCGRVTDGVAPQRVTSFPLFGLRLARRRLMARTPGEETATTLWAAPRFARLVTRRGFGGAAGFYGFSGDSLEQLLAAREAGLWTVVEQIIAPRRLLDRLLKEEEAAFPDWHLKRANDRNARAFGERERAEWEAADLVVCGSEFVFDAVTKASGGSARCLVVPYGVDRRFALPPRPPRQGPLRVLTIGRVGGRLSPAVALRGIGHRRLRSPDRGTAGRHDREQRQRCARRPGGVHRADSEQRGHRLGTRAPGRRPGAAGRVVGKRRAACRRLRHS